MSILYSVFGIYPDMSLERALELMRSHGQAVSGICDEGSKYRSFVVHESSVVKDPLDFASEMIAVYLLEKESIVNRVSGWSLEREGVKILKCGDPMELAFGVFPNQHISLNMSGRSYLNGCIRKDVNGSLDFSILSDSGIVTEITLGRNFYYTPEEARVLLESQ